MKKFIIIKLSFLVLVLISCEKVVGITNTQETCEQYQGKKWENGQCVDQKTFTITWKRKTHIHDVVSIVTSNSYAGALSDTDSCAQVTEAEFKKLKISVVGEEGKNIILCNSSDDSNTDDDCSANNYQIIVKNDDPDGYELKIEANKASTSCKPLLYRVRK